MRLEKLDILRWLAILLMVIFHINYSLVHLFNKTILNFSDIFWFTIWRSVAVLFIIVSWISFFLAEKKYWKKINLKYFKVSIVLWVIALLISLWTSLFFPEQYIRFWIIHFFSLSFILILLFRKLWYYNLLLAILFIIYGFYYIPVINNEYLYFLGFKYPSFSSADFYPILPYFWFMLFWYVFALFLKDKDKLNIFKISNKKNFINISLEYLWKKSLVIYLIHQPIIIWIIYLVK